MNTQTKGFTSKETRFHPLLRGFTLVEIMIVVVIIGLLAAIAIPAFNKARMKSRETMMDNDARLLSNAAQYWYLQGGRNDYPFNYRPRTGQIATNHSSLVLHTPGHSTHKFVDYIGRDYEYLADRAVGTGHHFTIYRMHWNQNFHMRVRGINYEEGLKRWYTPEGIFLGISEDDPEEDS